MMDKITTYKEQFEFWITCTCYSIQKGINYIIHRLALLKNIACPAFTLVKRGSLNQITCSESATVLIMKYKKPLAILISLSRKVIDIHKLHRVHAQTALRKTVREEVSCGVSVKIIIFMWLQR